MMKKIAFCLFLFLNTTMMLAQDLNEYLLDRLTASWQCRQVDYEDMTNVVLNNKDNLDSYLRGLATTADIGTSPPQASTTSTSARFPPASA